MIFEKKGSSSNYTLKSHILYVALYQQPLFMPLLPTSKDGLCGAHSRGKMRRHTGTKYFAKSKIEQKRANNSYNHDQEVHVCGMWNE